MSTSMRTLCCALALGSMLAVGLAPAPAEAGKAPGIFRRYVPGTKARAEWKAIKTEFSGVMRDTRFANDFGLQRSLYRADKLSIGVTGIMFALLSVNIGSIAALFGGGAVGIGAGVAWLAATTPVIFRQWRGRTDGAMIRTTRLTKGEKYFEKLVNAEKTPNLWNFAF